MYSILKWHMHTLSTDKTFLILVSAVWQWKGWRFKQTRWAHFYCFFFFWLCSQSFVKRDIFVELPFSTQRNEELLRREDAPSAPASPHGFQLPHPAIQTQQESHAGGPRILQPHAHPEEGKEPSRGRNRPILWKTRVRLWRGALQTAGCWSGWGPGWGQHVRGQRLCPHAQHHLYLEVQAQRWPSKIQHQHGTAAPGQADAPRWTLCWAPSRFRHPVHPARPGQHVVFRERLPHPEYPQHVQRVSHHAQQPGEHIRVHELYDVQERDHLHSVHELLGGKTSKHSCFILIYAPVIRYWTLNVLLIALIIAETEITICWIGLWGKRLAESVDQFTKILNLKVKTSFFFFFLL